MGPILKYYFISSESEKIVQDFCQSCGKYKRLELDHKILDSPI